MTEIVLIAHNLRSSHNVGSLLRTADGLGVSVYLTGYTPYPVEVNDKRLPHLARKTHRQIQKTALGAETTVNWHHQTNLAPLLRELKEQTFVIAALEQDNKATSLATYKSPVRIALVVGRETEGIEPEVLKQCDIILEIPMRGKKESFNVVQASAMALYHLIYLS